MGSARRGPQTLRPRLGGRVKSFDIGQHDEGEAVFQAAPNERREAGEATSMEKQAPGAVCHRLDAKGVLTIGRAKTRVIG